MCVLNQASCSIFTNRRACGWRCPLGSRSGTERRPRRRRVTRIAYCTLNKRTRTVHKSSYTVHLLIFTIFYSFINVHILINRMNYMKRCSLSKTAKRMNASSGTAIDTVNFSSHTAKHKQRRHRQRLQRKAIIYS